MALRSQLFALATTLALATSPLAAQQLAAQQLQVSPPTDTSAQASPIQPAPKAHATDAATESSPAIGPAPRHTDAIAPGTAIRATLAHAIDSGNLTNGQTLHARLAAPLRTRTGASLPPGTPVVITVIGTVPAGKLTAAGEFSLQAVRVGPIDTVTDIKTYRGEPGHREVADATPALGTNAGLAAGAAIEFRVSKPPAPAASAPGHAGLTPGSVDATANGSKPDPGAVNTLPSYGTTTSSAH